MESAVKTLILFSGFSLLAATSVHAEIYLCKDAGGRTLTADRPIPECADRAMRQYGKNGMVHKEIPAPLTVEQKQEKLAQQEKKKAEDAAADEQRRADRALLARFHIEADIEQARVRDSAAINEQIVLCQKAVTAAEKDWKIVDALVATQKQSGKVSPVMQNKAAGAEQRLLDAKIALQDKQTELTLVNMKYEKIVHRYREISVTSNL